MLTSFLKNRTLSLLILSFSVSVLFLIPTTLSVQTGVTSLTANAQFTDLAAGAGATIGTALAGDGGANWSEEVGIWLGNGLLTIGAFFAGIGGFLLDGAINILVIGMSELLVNSGVGVVINDIWGIIRDFGNLIFIFGFIYIGIRTILQPESADTKRFLAQLIIAALLINFSLFFTKVVIDVANVFAVEVHSLLQNDGEGSIAITLTKRAGLDSLYNPAQGTALAQATTGGSIAFFVMGFMFLLVAAFVFAAGAVMLIIRFVALVFIMIFSPLMFAALVFPETAKHAKKLASLLISYAFFAPIFLFLIYVSLNVLEATMSTSLGGGSFAEGVLPNTSYAVTLQFILAIMFLIFSLKSAQSLSLVGGNQMVKAGKWARGHGQRLMGGATLGLAARTGRNTVGYVGHTVTESKWARNLATRGGAAGFLGRQSLSRGKQLSEASFDPRRVGGLGKALDIGEGKKGGYAQTLKDVEKRNTDLSKMLGEDERLYKDNGVTKQLDFYKETVSKRKELFAELSNTSDEGARKDIAEKIGTLDREINYMDNANDKDAVMPTTMTSEFAGEEEQFKKFLRVKKSAKDQRTEQYVANLEKRGSKLPPGVRHIYNWTINDPVANKAASDSIRKSLKKSENDKLVDAIKSSGSKDE